jgi:hypothetical protein
MLKEAATTVGPDKRIKMYSWHNKDHRACQNTLGILCTHDFFGFLHLLPLSFHVCTETDPKHTEVMCGNTVMTAYPQPVIAIYTRGGQEERVPGFCGCLTYNYIWCLTLDSNQKYEVSYNNLLP